MVASPLFGDADNRTGGLKPSQPKPAWREGCGRTAFPPVAGASAPGRAAPCDAEGVVSLFELERKPQAAGRPAAAPSRAPSRHIPSRPVSAERESSSEPLAGGVGVPNPATNPVTESECRPRRAAPRGALPRARMPRVRPSGSRACEPP